MKTYYKNDLHKTYLILEGNESDTEDYQIAMLRENHIPGILKTDMRYMDNQSHYYYDISGKTSFKNQYEKSHLRSEDIKRLLAGLLDAIRSLQKYMLDGNCILLDPDYIFCNDKELFFCYYPSVQCDAKEEFHKLTEFFVREINYKDEEGVRFAYTLHKATMEDNYSLEQIMERLFDEKSEDVPQTNYVEMMDHSPMEDEKVAEQNNLWEPVRKLLEKTKRSLWGEEDD